MICFLAKLSLTMGPIVKLSFFFGNKFSFLLFLNHERQLIIGHYKVVKVYMITVVVVIAVVVVVVDNRSSQIASFQNSRNGCYYFDQLDLPVKRR